MWIYFWRSASQIQYFDISFIKKLDDSVDIVSLHDLCSARASIDMTM
jgi:hypothetical protein